MTEKLNFFITVTKSTNEVIIQEGNLVSVKIPKHWQKPDSNVRNPALWVCHLMNNSTGISLVSFYPSELIIKKYGIIYRGKLDPSGSNEKEEFYRCELLREEIQGTNWITIFLILLIMIIAFSALGAYGFRRGVF